MIAYLRNWIDRKRVYGKIKSLSPEWAAMLVYIAASRYLMMLRWRSKRDLEKLMLSVWRDFQDDESQARSEGRFFMDEYKFTIVHTGKSIVLRTLHEMFAGWLDYNSLAELAEKA